MNNDDSRARRDRQRLRRAGFRMSEQGAGGDHAALLPQRLASGAVVAQHMRRVSILY